MRWPCNWRSISTSTSTGRGISAKSPARYERIAHSRHRRQQRLRRRHRAARQRRDHRGRPRGGGEAARRAAGVDAGRCPARRCLARAGLHRRPGERRRRRPVQRHADRGGHQRHRCGASPVRHDGAAADADQRYVRQDARCHGGSAERCGGEPERARHSLRRAVHVAREARRARSGDVPRTRSARPRTAHVMAGAHRSRDAGARARAGRVHRRAGALRRARIARPFHGDICANQGGDRRRPHRLHASLQCDASAWQPRPRAYRCRARIAGRVVRHDRRRRARRAGDAAPRAARRGAADAGHRCHAAGRRRRA